MADKDISIRIKVDGKSYEADLGRAENATEKLGKESKATAADMHLLSSAANVFGGIIGGWSLLELGQQLFQVGRETESLVAALTTATGSSDKAKDAFEALDELASRMPGNTQQWTDAFVTLANRGLTASEKSLKSYAATAGALNKTVSDMVEAVADAVTGENERLKEFGVKAKDNGDTVIYTFRGVETEVRKNAADIESYLINLGETHFGESLANQMDTVGTVFDEAVEEINRLFADLGALGFNDLMRDAAAAVHELAEELRNDPTAAADWLTWLAKIGASIKLGFQEAGGALGLMAGIVANIGEDGFFDKVEAMVEGRRLDQVENLRDYEQRLNELDQRRDQAVADMTTRNNSETPALDSPTSPTGGGSSGGRSGSSKLAPEIKAEIKAAEEMLKLRDQHLEQLSKEAERVYQDTRTGQELLAQELTRLDELLAAGEVSWDTYARAVMNAEDAYAGAEDKAKAFAETSEGLFESLEGAIRGWGDNFTETMTDAVMTGKASFSDLAQSIIRDLIKIAIQKQITDRIIGVATSMFGGATGSTGGAGMTTQSAGGMAGGATQIRANGAGGGGAFRVSISNDGQSKQVKSARAEMDTEGMVLNVVISDVQRGGKLAGALEGTYPSLKRGNY